MVERPLCPLPLPAFVLPGRAAHPTCHPLLFISSFLCPLQAKSPSWDKLQTWEKDKAEGESFLTKGPPSPCITVFCKVKQNPQGKNQCCHSQDIPGYDVPLTSFHRSLDPPPFNPQSLLTHVCDSVWPQTHHCTFSADPGLLPHAEASLTLYCPPPLSVPRPD